MLKVFDNAKYKTKKTNYLCCFAPSRNRTWVDRIRTGSDNQLH